MPDMLVKLYELQSHQDLFKELDQKGIRIARAMAPSKHKVLEFVKKHFGDHWASECDVAFSNKPVSCFIAVNQDNEMMGFACYEVTCKAFFGPTGVLEQYRGLKIGKALLIKALEGLKEMGYAYAVIGGTEEAIGFYHKSVNAVVIPDSVPGIYRDMI